ncbi:MAG: bifunctional alpha/beta hydrolase/OsmC family protein [Acidimicrobiia bacterium]|nr:bifunctional alpha/beta hydrolase/OsmC family protein [Acidimicrobiia bacterium]
MRTDTRPVTFTGSGGDQLAARLDLPDGEPLAYALFAHCFTCSKDLAAATRISRGLADRGFGVLRFDFTGLGSSKGEFANTDFSSNIEDLVLAADWLRTSYEAPAALVGHSLGGAAVLAAASQVPEAVAVATIGAPFDPAHVTGLFPDAVCNRLGRDGESEVQLAGRTFRVRQQLLDDLGAQNLTEAIGSLRRALLVFHSPVDETVEVDNARQIFEAARHPRSFVSLDGADHLLTRRPDAAYVADVLSAWASRYLPDRPAEPAPADPEPGSVAVAETGDGAFQQLVAAGRHRFLADEPLGVGDDTGPTPYDLLLAGLGTCTSMTLRMYAGRKGWPLEGVEVRLSHDRIHAEDCADCEASSGLIETIDRTIELRGPLTQEQRSQLLTIADRCPVHRTLTGDIHISTRLLDTDLLTGGGPVVP